MNDEKFSSLAHHVIERVKDQDPRVGNFRFDVADKALKSLTETLIHVLHDIDPMGTSCTLNLDMEDEYDVEAFHTAVLLNSGEPLHEVICQVFDFWFWEGYLAEKWGEERLGEDRLNGLIAQIDESVHYVSSHRDMPALHRMLFENTIPYVGKNTSGWDYATFMRTAPEQLDPEARPEETTPGGYQVASGTTVIALDDESPGMDSEEETDEPHHWQTPNPGESDPAGVLPWLHYLLFEKTRRRVAPQDLLTYEEFRQLVLGSLDSAQAPESPFQHLYTTIPLPSHREP